MTELETNLNDAHAALDDIVYDIEIVKANLSDIEVDDIEGNCIFPYDLVTDQMKVDALKKHWEEFSLEDIDRMVSHSQL